MFSDWIWVQNVIFPLVGMGMGMTVLFMIYPHRPQGNRPAITQGDHS